MVNFYICAIEVLNSDKCVFFFSFSIKFIPLKRFDKKLKSTQYSRLYFKHVQNCTVLYRLIFYFLRWNRDSAPRTDAPATIIQCLVPNLYNIRHLQQKWSYCQLIIGAFFQNAFSKGILRSKMKVSANCQKLMIFKVHVIF